MKRYLPSILVAALLVAGCGGSDSSEPAKAAAESVTVDIKEFKYVPVRVEVARGGRIRWTNSDDAGHTATADDRSFDTQNIARREASAVSFTRAGTFRYHCDFHPFMKATVVVR